MKKLKKLMFVALFGVMSFGVFSAYDYVTMSEEEKFLLANVEALTRFEGDVVQPFTEFDFYCVNKKCNHYPVQGCLFTTAEDPTCTPGKCSACGTPGESGKL